MTVALSPVGVLPVLAAWRLMSSGAPNPNASIISLRILTPKQEAEPLSSSAGI
jgi:hypothetical protein